MRGIAKKMMVAVLSVTLVFAVSTTCFGAAIWGSYFGKNEGWIEGSEGSLSGADSITGFTANISTFGWGGVWGGRVFLDAPTQAERDANKGSALVKIKKGQEYTLNFTIQSSNVDKYVYVKISTGENLAYGYWQYLAKGKTTHVSTKFKAQADANAVRIAFGGDAGNRASVASDADAAVRYALFNQQYKKDYVAELSQHDCAVNGAQDFTAASKITVSDFSILPKTTVTAKSSKKKTVKVVAKKATTGVAKTVAGYQFKVGKKVITTTKSSVTVKKLKSKKKVKVQVRTYSGKKKDYGPWSSTKTVKVK